MVKDGDAMKRKQPKRSLTPGEPLPKFATAAEEQRFWLTHDFDDVIEAGGEQVAYEPQATRRPRMHVYRCALTTRRCRSCRCWRSVTVRVRP